MSPNDKKSSSVEDTDNKFSSAEDKHKTNEVEKGENEFDVDNPTTNVDEIPNDETDGRDRWDWESRWAPEAIFQIRCEAIWLSFMLVVSLSGIVLNWNGFISNLIACKECNIVTLNMYVYYFFGGMLGGTLFSIKYLYRMVARGYWHKDRSLWRFFAPFVSCSLAFAVGVLINAGLLGLTTKTSSSSTFIGIGFIVGYFADSALAKMADIAEVIFGHSSRRGL